MPDGSVEFVAKREKVLALDISESNEYASEWRYHGVHALKMGPWSNALPEIAAHIRAHDSNSSAKRDEDYAINKEKNITV